MDKPNVLAPRFEYIPEELTSRAQWVIWKAVYLPEKGKYNKIPINAKTLLAASSTDPATWSDFETARAAYLKHPAPSVNPEVGYAGVGFVLCDDDPFCGIDLDHVATSKTIDKAALDTIKMLNTYAEVSPSGTGIRLFALATLPPGGRKKGDVECYESGRFLTVTGRRLRDGSGAIESRQAEVEAFHAAAFPPAAPKSARAVETGTGLVSASDTDLLAMATGKAKNGDKIAALYSGNTAGYAGASEADFALCAYLAFWTGDDPARLDRLFRVSGLMRDKWDERRYSDGSTYGEMTVRRAIAGCTEFYKPRTTAAAKPGKPKPPTVETEPGFGGEPEGEEAEGLPTVVLTDRPDRDISGDAWSACLGQNEPPQLFSRGRGVAYLGRDSETKRLAVQEVDQEKMLHRLRRVADFVTVRQTKGGELHTHATPPLRIARDMLLDTDNIGTLPALRGVVYAPMIAPDGSLIAAHGYHACARVYVAMEGLAVTIPGVTKGSLRGFRPGRARTVLQFRRTMECSRF